MRFSFKKKNKEKWSLVLNIGSNEVSGAIVNINDEDKPIVLHVSNHQIKLSDNFEFDFLYKGMLSSLKEVLSDIRDLENNKKLREYGYKQSLISSVLVTLSSPWHFEEIRDFEYKQELPFSFSVDFMQQLLHEEKNIIEKDINSSGVLDKRDEITIIDQSVLDISLNKFNSDNLENKNVKELNATVFLGMMYKRVSDSILDLIERDFNERIIFMNTFSLTSFATLSFMENIEDSYILINLGGDVSDILIADTDKLEKTLSLPYGVNTIIRSISKKMNVDLSYAESIFKLYFDDKITNEKSRIVQKIIKEEVESLNGELKKALANINKDELPRQIFMISDVNGLILLERYFMLKRGQDNEFSFNDSKFSLSFIGEHMLSFYVDYNKGIKRDPYLSIETLFLSNREDLDRLLDM